MPSIQQRDMNVLWHPCTQMKDHEKIPLVPIKRGKGVWLEDFEGKRYLDGVSSWWVNLFGHSNPHINQAVSHQLEELEHVILAGFTHEPAVKLAEQLVQITPPGLDRVFYSDNGSSAVEVALKMSFHYWRNKGQTGKTRFITLSNGYHGETLGALSVGDISLFKETYEPLLLKVITAPSPDCYLRSPEDDWETHSRKMFLEMEKVLEKHAHESCAVILEPLVQCAGSMRMYHPVYLTLLREACDRHNVHIIADEIAVGFGRTGTLFACEQGNMTPDFMCLSKGLTGGYLPLAAVLTRNSIYEAFYDEYQNLTAFLHSHSYTGNPLGCAAALATLEIFQSQDVLGRNRQIAKRIWERCQKIEQHPNVAEVRQTGMITAIELVKDKQSKTPFDWQERRGLRVHQHAMTRGILLRPLGNVIYFMPPYVISDDEIDLMVDVAAEAIELAVQ